MPTHPLIAKTFAEKNADLLKKIKRQKIRSHGHFIGLDVHDFDRWSCGPYSFAEVTMKMQAGKYKGRDIEDCPSSYLLWVAENWNEKTAAGREVCAAADKEWLYREKTGCHFEEEK